MLKPSHERLEVRIEVLVSSLVKSLLEPSRSVTFAAARELKGFDGLQTGFVVIH